MALLCLPASAVDAQGLLARAAQRVAVLSAEVALSQAVTIDVSAAGGVTVPYGELQAGISTVDLVAGSVIRIHLFLRNGGDVAVTMPLPPDTAFVLVDGSGRRLPRLSVRAREGVVQGLLTVPALERVRLDLVFTLDKSATGEGALKVGAATVIRGMPLQQGAAPPPSPAAPTPAPPAAPPDTAIPPR